MIPHPSGLRCAQQAQRPTPLLQAFLRAVIAAFSWQTCSARPAGSPPPVIQASSSPDGSLPTVTIEAKQELERRVYRFVASQVFQVPGESIMRWNKAICPFAAGLPRMFDDYIQGRISQIARAANAQVGGKDCKADFYVIASYDPELFLKKLWAQAPEMYDTRSELGGVHRFLRSRDPVRVLFNSQAHCRVNSIDGGKSSDMMARFLGGGGTQVNTTSSYFCGGGGSRLSYSAVNSIQSALVVVDMNRMQGITTRELADYVAMIGLADIRPDAKAADAPTILRLFQHPEPPPAGLSTWDVSLLYSIYNTNQSSVLQMPDMEKMVVARIEHHSDPGETSSGSSASLPPLWVNEVIPQRNSNIISWYRAAAEHGDAEAQYALGFMYDSGQGVPQDYTKAARWFAKAAEQGSAAAQYDLGLMFARGQSASQNYTTAAEWYRRAADHGDAQAQSSLGLAYANGQGVPRSYAQATQWFRKAAEQGYADAQFDLGVMYANGGGVPRDYVEACKWWLLADADSGAADDSHRLSLHKLSEAASQMTADQMVRAHREASEWLTAHHSAQCCT